ncbi:General amino-acid permease GAP1 [Candida viswanathii]|uniref:General amino-acid permease GAP1 n=1 Tax=Candida viswanathii TaxID=5486 RepID=A0A367YE25_9ASCO|nr:General amino-acid permease GAP1 [Candida viswanathii]
MSSPDYKMKHEDIVLNSSSDELTASESNKHSFKDFVYSFKIDRDLEVGYEDITTPDDLLKDYQVKLIALATCIGGGLFVSSAAAISSAGAGGTLVGYSIVAGLMFLIVQSLGELTSTYPVKGNFLVYNSRFLDESWAFAMNWNYCLQWIVAIPISLVSASLTIQYWTDKVNPAAWVAILWVVLVGISIFGVKGYGYSESLFSLIKVIAIIMFVIAAIVLTAGGGKQGYIGGANWHPPFVNGLPGCCNTLVNAAYSFSGTELTAIAAAETANPRKALRKAMKQIFWRILVFYMLAITMVCFLVRYDDPSLLGNSKWPVSPFVIGLSNGGIKALPDIINAAILVALLSAANASVFATYKPLVALAEAGHGPKFLGYVDRKGRPMYSILIAVGFGLIGLAGASDGGSEMLLWMLAISGLSAILLWGSVSLAHIRVHRAYKVQGIDTENVPFRAIGGIWGAYCAFLVSFLILVAQFYIALYPIGGERLNASNFFKAYLAVPIVVVFYAGHKIWTRNWSLYIRAKDMDVTTGRSMMDLEVIKQEIADDKELLARKPLWYKFFNFWC